MIASATWPTLEKTFTAIMVNLRLVGWILLLPLTLKAQMQTVITGKVEEKSGMPIIGANIFIANSYEGTSSDHDGEFKFTTIRTDSQIVVCSYLGFQSNSTPVILRGDSIDLIIRLREAPLEFNEIVITAGSFEAGGESKREILKPLDIVTTAGATADIAGALNTLPGTMTVGESGRLFVRGGEGHETKTFIDGVQVQGFYSPSAPNTPTRSRFLPFMFRGTSFSTGGYSAEYGQALSSALILNSKPIAELDRIDVSLLSVGADLSFTEAWDKSSLSAKIQYTNIDPYFSVINQNIDWIDPPTSIEGMAAFRKRIGQNGMIKLFGNVNRSSLSLNQEDFLVPELKIPTSIDNDYNYLNATISFPLKNDWNVFGGVSSTYNADRITHRNDQLYETDWGWHGKIRLKKLMSDQLNFNAGVEVLVRSVEQEHRILSADLPTILSISENLVATFLELDVQFLPSLLGRIGLRSEYRGYTDSYHIHPRLSLAFKTGEYSQVSAAFGKFQQLPLKRWLIKNQDLHQESALHYILNYQITRNSRTFRIEAFSKEYDQLVKYGPAPDPAVRKLNNGGFGLARGFDLFWRDNRSFDQIDYWISYSYLDTYRDYLDYPHQAVPAFTSKHNMSIVYKHFINPLKSQIGCTYSFASGRPYENPNLPGFLNNHTKAYHDLSLNFSYLMRQNMIIHGSVTNVLGRDHVFGYEFSDRMDSDGHYPGRAIRLPAKRFMFLGLFLTLSKDPVLNQLPNL